MIKMFILLLLCFSFLGCEERHPFREGASQPPEDKPVKPPQKPTPDTIDQKYPEVFYLEYVQSNKGEAAKITKVCPEPPEFEIGGICHDRMALCKRADQHIYQCRPRVIRVSGKIIDADTKEPIVGARVAGYMVAFGELGFTKSDKDGDFMLNQSSICPHFVVVHADQYHALDNMPFGRGGVRCTVEAYGGSSGTVVEMRKLHRTISNQDQISTPSACHFLGFVKDDQNKPLADVNVYCDGGQTAVTNTQGLYTIHSDNKFCPLVCNARKDGYVAKIHGVTNAVSTFGASPADMILVKKE